MRSGVCDIEPNMNSEKKSLLNRIRTALESDGQDAPDKDKRHPLRSSPEYEELKWAAAKELDELYERIVLEIKRDISAIESTVGGIAQPMAEQLANGAVADVFEAAAEVLKARIRGASKSGG